MPFRFFLLLCSVAACLQLPAQYDSALTAWIKKIPPQLKRTQMPAAPYNYTVEEITYSSTATGLRYGATFTKPKNNKHYPVVVLLNGTGAQDRDYTAYFHKYYWVLADYLSSRGIGVLRFDDRGKGQTTGIFDSANTADLAQDAMAAVQYLQTRKDVDDKNIGLIGHSEGGIVAPMVYTRMPGAISFMVLLAPPVIGLRAINHFQEELFYHLLYKSDSLIQARLYLHDMIMKKIPGEANDRESTMRTVKASLAQFAAVFPASVLDSLQLHDDERTANSLVRTYTGFLTPWWRYILPYDPATDIRQVHCPVLSIFGTKDQQVPPKEDKARLAELLPPNAQSVSLLLEGINHFMQPAKTGIEKEYFYSEQTMDPRVLNAVTDWIKGLKK